MDLYTYRLLDQCITRPLGQYISRPLDQCITHPLGRYRVHPLDQYTTPRLGRYTLRHRVPCTCRRPGRCKDLRQAPYTDLEAKYYAQLGPPFLKSQHAIPLSLGSSSLRTKIPDRIQAFVSLHTAR